VRTVSSLQSRRCGARLVDRQDPYRGCFALSVLGILGCGGFLMGIAYVVSLIIKFAGW